MTFNKLTNLISCSLALGTSSVRNINYPLNLVVGRNKLLSCKTVWRHNDSVGFCLNHIKESPNLSCSLLLMCFIVDRLISFTPSSKIHPLSMSLIIILNQLIPYIVKHSRSSTTLSLCIITVILFSYFFRFFTFVRVFLILV